jgi:hypothetical protein
LGGQQKYKKITLTNPDKKKNKGKEQNISIALNNNESSK